MRSEKQNKAFFWATSFLRELYACGISHLIISPGSRSTPLTLAAAGHPALKTHVVLDERSAAYIAVGIAKSSGKPAGLICTSGTAAANYFPAIVEARHSGVPMLVFTADRPPHLRNVGASQAIDQIKLYGDYPVFFHEAGEPVIESDDIKRLKTAASQAYHAAITKKGVAHVNFPFRKPLEPAPDYVKQVEKENKAQQSNSQSAQTHFFPGTESQKLPKKIVKLFEKSSKPVIIDGPTGVTRPNTSVVELAGILQAPLLSEFPLLSCNTLVSSFDGFLKNQEHRTKLKADLLIRFGQQPVSKAIQLYLNDHADVPHIHFADLEEWQDETHSVTHRFKWDGKPVKWNLKLASIDQKWLDLWQSTEQSFNHHKKEIVNQKSALTDGFVFNWLGKQIPTRWNVFLSNSFPVRDWMLFAGSPPHRTFVNRGASGIDGIISTAIGATIASQKPGILWIGDLATLHDSNALLSSTILENPLIVVVLNNRGGNIFRMLPIHEHKEQYTNYFETPQQASFEYLANMHSLPYRSINTRKQLMDLSLQAIDSPGIHIVECITDPEASMQERNELWNFTEQNAFNEKNS